MTPQPEFTRVRSVETIWEARIIREILEDAGIPTFIQGIRTADTTGLMFGGPALPILVPTERVQEASDLIDEVKRKAKEDPGPDTTVRRKNAGTRTAKASPAKPKKAARKKAAKKETTARATGK